jgi:hypothetical protein
MATIKGVEIFQEGTWNGHTITSETLTDIVNAFGKTSAVVKPVLKLGHNDQQKLLAKDGMPAAGWVSDVYIQGKKLLADFVDIPKKIAELIKAKAYRKVSVEIFSGVKLGGEKFPNLLGAVALLGADTPAVLSLADIPTEFANNVENVLSFTMGDNAGNIETKKFDIEIKGKKHMSNEETKTPAPDYAKQIAEQSKQIAELSGQVKEFKSSNEASQAKIVELQKGKLDAEIQRFTTELKAKDLIAPSMEAHVNALASSETAKTEFSIGDKKLSQMEVIEELLKLAKAVYSINKEEKTVDAKPKEGEDSFEEKHKKIEAYCSEHKVSYTAAYKALAL